MGDACWKAAWLSEIEKFPCAVLAHHYPDVPNLGDMTTLPNRIRSGEVEAPDVFCGGTPCQAFSVAGLRKSLDDARGNLSLTFCEIANAIDNRRFVRGKSPSIVFWENVPGVLNTKDNAFGCFLGALAGEDDALIPPGGRWSNAGFIDGPQRAVAWRVLDAQYFGVAQRRRRVFVVASARDDFDPASVLFEFEGVRRDIAPGRKARKVTPTISSSGTGVSRVGFNCEDEWFIETPVIANTIAARTNAALDVQSGTFVPSKLDQQTVGALCADSHPGAYSGQDAYTGRLIPALAYGIPGNWIGRKPENGGNAVEPMYDIAPCLTKADQHAVAQPIPIDTMNMTPGHSSGGLGFGQPGDPSFTLTKGHSHAVAQPIAFEPGKMKRLGYGNAEAGLAPTLRADAGDNQLAVAQPIGLDEEQNAMIDAFGTLKARVAGGGFEGTVMQSNMAVRRLTPVECERLQGFPDNYTKIADKTPDGPRYKALGNSWAVPVVRWIGERIARGT